MNNHERLLSAISATQDGALKLLETLVNINTYTTNVAGVNRAQDEIEKFLSGIGMKLERIKLKKRGDVIVGRSAAVHKKTALLVGHVDTVHSPESPFQTFSRTATTASGPGCLDMKSGLVTMLWTLKTLSDLKLLDKIPVTIIVNSDEEVGSDESGVVIDAHAKNASAALVFEWGRAKDAIILRRKGIAMFDLEVKGKAAHSGNNHKEGANAIVQIAHTISRLSALTDYANAVTVNVGIVQGGSTLNTVPDFASTSFEFRIERVEDYARMKGLISEIQKDIVVTGTEITLRERAFMPPMVETAASAELFESFRRFAKDSGLEYEKFPGIIGGGSDANRTSYNGVPSIDGLGPFGEFPHSDREYIRLDSLPKKMANLGLWLLSQTV
jgi:glutamate carboxypeptidase